MEIDRTASMVFASLAAHLNHLRRWAIFPDREEPLGDDWKDLMWSRTDHHIRAARELVQRWDVIESGGVWTDTAGYMDIGVDSRLRETRQLAVEFINAMHNNPALSKTPASVWGNRFPDRFELFKKLSAAGVQIHWMAERLKSAAIIQIARSL